MAPAPAHTGNGNVEAPPPPSKDAKKIKDEKKEEDLSEEDLALKHQLELYVERVQDSDPGLQKTALESMRNEELSQSKNVAYNAGGATQNSIRVAQWMLQVPRIINYIGYIGKDKFGEEMKKNSLAAGVNLHYYEDETTPTRTCTILVVGGERSLIANLLVANCYKSDHLKSPENWALVSPESMMLVEEHAAKAGKIFMMNLVAPFICQFFKDDSMKVFSRFVPSIQSMRQR